MKKKTVLTAFSAITVCALQIAILARTPRWSIEKQKKRRSAGDVSTAVGHEIIP